MHQRGTVRVHQIACGQYRGRSRERQLLLESGPECFVICSAWVESNMATSSAPHWLLEGSNPSLRYRTLTELLHERCRELVDYFPRRNCIYKLRKPDEYVRADIVRTQFPIIWQTSALEILWSLSRMGIGRHPATQAAWEALEAKRTDDGRYVTDWTPTQSLLKAGKRGQPDKWITFYALQAIQYRDGTDTKLE
jgi:hypothetical protein